MKRVNSSGKREEAEKKKFSQTNIHNIIAGPDRSALLFLLSENIERKRTMQTASMRQNIFKNLKTHGNTAFGSVRPYAPISLPDNEHLFGYSIGKLSVRLRC